MQNCCLTWQYVNNSLHIWWQLWHIPPWVSSGCGNSPVLSLHHELQLSHAAILYLTSTTIILVWSWHNTAAAVYLDHVLGSVVTCTKQSSETLCQPLCYYCQWQYGLPSSSTSAAPPSGLSRGGDVGANCQWYCWTTLLVRPVVYMWTKISYHHPHLHMPTLRLYKKFYV